LIHGHAIGSATTQAAATSALRRADVPVDDYFKDLEPFLDRVSADHPHYDEWSRENPVRDMDPERMWSDSFLFGLERMLDGLELWLNSGKPPGKAAPAATDAG
jgi:hypothetical protein